jgi:thioredoxin-dependent peroxiredoxin
MFRFSSFAPHKQPAKLSQLIPMLKPGDKAPAFRLQSDEDKTVALKDFKGRRVLLFFFPKANTPG